jgi:hypothetical protein
MKRDLNQDLAYLKSAAEDLEAYLLSPVLFWPLSGSKGVSLQGESSQLTPGNLLLCKKRVNNGNWSDDERKTIGEINSRIQQILEKWQSTWQKKAAEDLAKRIKVWTDYLTNLAQSPQRLRGDYAYNVRQRVILQLLSDEIKAGEPENSLKVLDQRLRNIVQTGDFLWEKELAKGFPAELFWYLYVNP